MLFSVCALSPCVSLLGLLGQKYHGLGDKQQKFIFSQYGGAQKSTIKVWPFWLFLRLLSFLACRPSSYCIFTWPLLWALTQLLSLLIKDTSLLDQGLTFLTLFNLDYLLKDPISRYTHIKDQTINACILGGHDSVHDSSILMIKLPPNQGR